MTANTPILPALTANERGADRGWPDEKVKGLAAYLLPVLREQAAETRTKVGHLMAPNEVPMQHAAADLIEHLLAERTQHAAEIAAAVQAEREEIAVMHEEWAELYDRTSVARARHLVCAEKIRARGTTDAVERVEAGVREKFREALEAIAEEHDAGRHDGLPEPCPAHDADTMFAIARAALRSDDGEGQKA